MTVHSCDVVSVLHADESFMYGVVLLCRGWLKGVLAMSFMYASGNFTKRDIAFIIDVL